jgi:hypothetical protein
MPMRWRVSRSAGAPDMASSGLRTVVPWLLLVLGAVLAVGGASGVWSAADLTLRGTSNTAKVIAHERSNAGRNNLSVYAQVEVTAPGGQAVRTEVFDQFGAEDWIDGGTVVVRCKELAAGALQCGPDSLKDRWLMPVVFLVAGSGILWWGWRRRRTLPDPAAKGP